jgi:hypothetical protein
MKSCSAGRRWQQATTVHSVGAAQKVGTTNIELQKVEAEQGAVG